MLISVIKDKKEIVSFDTLKDEYSGDVEQKFIELNDNEKVKSIHLEFDENTTLDDVNDIFRNNESKDGKVIKQVIELWK